MTKNKFFKGSLYFTGIVTVGIWSLLIWNHYHGGVPSHHILHQQDLPAISNWWGGLLLPLLTLFLAYRMQNRLIRNNDNKSSSLKLPIEYIYGFLFALSFGILLSLFFTLGYSNLLGYMMYGLFLLALFFPVYRAECFLGFVIGMTFTFGAVLPTGVGAIFALIGVVLYLYVRTGIIFVIKKVIPLLSPNKDNIKKNI
ncbi:MAG: hypothetical protein GY865_02365 [candidate division Zixibacteria bacterium]|nr:hypothetical protein [candidate division Zixibacteria bacterium]